jgi:hypothetical protein
MVQSWISGQAAGVDVAGVGGENYWAGAIQSALGSHADRTQFWVPVWRHASTCNRPYQWASAATTNNDRDVYSANVVSLAGPLQDGVTAYYWDIEPYMRYSGGLHAKFADIQRAALRNGVWWPTGTCNRFLYSSGCTPKVTKVNLQPGPDFIGTFGLNRAAPGQINVGGLGHGLSGTRRYYPVARNGSRDPESVLPAWQEGNGLILYQPPLNPCNFSGEYACFLDLWLTGGEAYKLTQCSNVGCRSKAFLGVLAGTILNVVSLGGWKLLGVWGAKPLTGPGAPAALEEEQSLAIRFEASGQPDILVEGDQAKQVLQNLQPQLSIQDAQFGVKVGKHARDYGLDPSDPAARSWVRTHIEDIHDNPDEVHRGAWHPTAGGGSAYWFYRKGTDVVVTQGDGTFVTILKDGQGNGWYSRAARIWP